MTIASAALLEGIIVAGATMAAYDPEIYGWALAVVLPFVFGNDASTIENTPVLSLWRGSVSIMCMS